MWLIPFARLRSLCLDLIFDHSRSFASIPRPASFLLHRSSLSDDSIFSSGINQIGSNYMATILRVRVHTVSRYIAAASNVNIRLPTFLSLFSPSFLLHFVFPWKRVYCSFVERASTRRLFRGENNGMRVERWPPLIILENGWKDLFSRLIEPLVLKMT